jgi:methylated-DNA-protein-cysteine methyltransferase-like protein
MRLDCNRLTVGGGRLSVRGVAEVDNPPDPNYYERVYALVATVPAGRVVTYGQVAQALGVHRGARAVGYALRALSDTEAVPWWRVVNASGGISPRGLGHAAAIQREILDAEGVQFRLDGTIDLDRYRAPLRPE